MAVAIAAEFSRPARRVEALVAGKNLRTGRTFESFDPSDPGSVVSRGNGVRTWRGRRGSPGRHPSGEDLEPHPGYRSAHAVLFAAADRMRRARHEIAALEVREAGKGWADADADVCEAVDFCEYYAQADARARRRRRGPVASGRGEPPDLSRPRASPQWSRLGTSRSPSRRE